MQYLKNLMINLANMYYGAFVIGFCTQRAVVNFLGSWL